MDRYIEQFFMDRQNAVDTLATMRANYSEAGMYECAGGFLVWADRTTDDRSV